MSWRSEWQAISGNIQGFVAAAKSFVQSPGADIYGVARKQLLPHAKRLYEKIVKFKEDYETILPAPACECISLLIRDRATLFLTTNPIGVGSEREDVQGRSSILESIQAEVTYHLSDFSVVAKRLSERAFLHLQRSIVADQAVKQRWVDAFERGEVVCEKLGGAHLLLHGIWAFKASAEGGGCTDLVLGEPLEDPTEAESVAEALVLTEWKAVHSLSEQKRKAQEARSQASLYARGVLGGLELKQYRYVVLVSKDWLPEIPDIPEGDIIYRHINIAVDPKCPSRAARAKSK